MRKILFTALTALALCLGLAGVAYAGTPATGPVKQTSGLLCPLGEILSTVAGTDEPTCRHRHWGGRYGGRDTVIVTGGGACGTYGGCNTGAVLVPSYGSTYGGADCNCNSGVSYTPQVSRVPVGGVETGDGSCATIVRGARSWYRGLHHS